MELVNHAVLSEQAHQLGNILKDCFMIQWHLALTWLDQAGRLVPFLVSPLDGC